MSGVGFIGYGVVGKATANLFIQSRSELDLLAYDPAKVKIDDGVLSSGVEEIAKVCDVIFICVPTPGDPGDGHCDASLVVEAVELIAEEASAVGRKPFVVIRSTTVPSEILYLCERFGEIVRLVVMPEFLAEKKLVETNFRPEVLVVGVNEPKDAKEFLDFLSRKSSLRVKAGHMYVGLPADAAFFKYALNSFLAMKVAWANEMVSFAEAMPLSGWSWFKTALECEPRVGVGQMDVPGPDGEPGFSGRCLPKDLRALISEFASFELDSPVLDGVLTANQKIRPHDMSGNSITGE